MFTVIEPAAFIRQAKNAGISEVERAAMLDSIAANPNRGVVIEHSGGCRKVRFAGRGKGKSGGYRTVHYVAAARGQVFMLALLGKGERANFSRAELNALKAALARL